LISVYQLDEDEKGRQKGRKEEKRGKRKEEKRGQEGIIKRREGVERARKE
jgi:hypothetical protein